jgi:hypothetical protein
MRSGAEIQFRLRQELVNRLMLWWPPKAPLERAGFRYPVPEFAANVPALAQEILAHRFPLLGTAVETGPEIRWRRDYLHGLETGTEFFRRIPYLDRDKAGDHKVIWELNRHQHLVVLALAGETGEIERQLTSWWEQNPFQRGINWASALEVAFRALSWLQVLSILGDRTPKRQQLLDSLYQHGLHLEYNLSFYFSRNTHLLGEALALAALGELFPRWKELGIRTLRRELDHQVLADGAHFEKSSYYHVYTLDMYLLAWRLAGKPAEWRPKLTLMAEYLAALLGEGGEIPLIGDDDGGRLFHPYGTHVQYGRQTLEWAAADLGRPFIAKQESERFAECGLIFLRAGGTEVIVDAGGFGGGRGGHSHSDTLQIIVRRGGRELLIDPGTYTYVGDPRWRDWFRGSAAHNTMRVGGREQAEAAGPFGWRSKPEVMLHGWGPDYVDAECRYGGCAHRRRVRLTDPLHLIVEDEASGGEGEQWWHLAAGAPVQFEFPEGLRAEPAEGWRSRALYQKEPAQRFVVRGQKLTTKLTIGEVWHP